jgi:hypothetical protein
MHVHDFNKQNGNCFVCYPNGKKNDLFFFIEGRGRGYGKTYHSIMNMDPRYTGSRRPNGSYIDVKFKVKE